MIYDEIQQARKKTIGLKQTIKAIEKGLARRVYVASDADEHVLKPVLKLCKDKSVPVVMVDSKQKLGQVCGIEVGAAMIGVVEE